MISSAKSYLPILLFGSIITVVVLAVDPSAYSPYHTPKNFGLLVGVAVALVAYWGLAALWRQSYSVTISVIEVLLVVRIAWCVITNPSWMTHPSDVGFWLLVALTLLAFLARQTFAVKERSFDDPITGRFRTRAIGAFLHVIWITALIQALRGFRQAYEAGAFQYTSQFAKTPMQGTIGPVNGYGSFLAIGAIAAFTVVANADSRKMKVGVGLAACLIVAALLANMSRGALLSLVGACFLVLCARALSEDPHQAPRSGRVSLMRTVALLKEQRGIQVASAAVLVICTAGFGYGLYQLNPASTYGRIMIWEISTPMFFDHPITGVGKGEFGEEYLNYQAQYFGQPEHQQLAYKAADLGHPHSEYLNAFCSTGFIGGVLFLLIWGMTLWYLLQFLFKNETGRTSLLHLGLLGLLLVLLIHATVDSVFHVLPLYVAAHIALGLIPAPSWSFYGCSESRFKLVLAGLIALTLEYASFALQKSWHQYPGYIAWERGTQTSYMEALPRLKIALQRLPKRGELQFFYGQSLVSVGFYSKGIGYLKKSLENFNSQDLHLALATAYLNLGNLKKAERHAREAQAMFPDQLKPRLLLGKIYYEQGKIRRSKALIVECMQRDTHIQSRAVKAVARRAESLWKTLYSEDSLRISDLSYE